MNGDVVASAAARSEVASPSRVRLAVWSDRTATWCLIGLAAILPYGHTGRIQSTLLAGAIAGWVGRWYADRTFQWTRTPVDLPMALYVAWGIVGLMAAVDITYSAREIKNELVTQAVLFVLSVSLARRKRDVIAFTRVIAFAAVVMGVYAVWQFDWHFSQSILYTVRWNRSAAFTSDAIFLGSYLVLVVPVVFFVALSEGSPCTRAVAWAVFGVLLLAVVSTGTRAAGIALIGQFLVYGILKRRRFFITILFVSLLVGWQIVSWENISKTDWMHDGKRLTFWSHLIPHIINAPLMGYGYGQETPPRALSSVYDEISFDKNHTFNTFFNVAVELGLAGLALFVFLLWRLGTLLWRGLRRTSEPSMQVFFLCTLMVLIGFMIRNQFDHMFRDAPGHLFWILMGLGVGRAVASDDERPHAAA